MNKPLHFFVLKSGIKLYPNQPLQWDDSEEKTLVAGLYARFRARALFVSLYDFFKEGFSTSPDN